MKYEKGSFITVPNRKELVGLNSMAQVVFMWLCFHSNQEGECYPSHVTVSKEAGLGRTSVKKAISILVDAGLIEKENRKDGKKNKTNLYQVIIGEVGRVATHLGRVTTEGVGRVASSELNPSSLTKSNKIPFNEFWEMYDKKIGKPKSENKWNKLPLEEQKSILEYIPKYKHAQPNKSYRKNPETFLNNRSWEDEIIEDQKINNGKWKCEYGYWHEKNQECGHGLQRQMEKKSSQFADQLKNKFKI